MYPLLMRGGKNVELYEHVILSSGAKILAGRAKFVMKKYSGAAENLTVITGTHLNKVGWWYLNITNDMKPEKLDRDVVLEEDVWLGMNVTLLLGVTVGRGAIVGSGAVVRDCVPPYAIAIGNPARVVGFKFTPEEIIEHERLLYPEEERIPEKKLFMNYEKYYWNKREDIIKFMGK
jgi:acetyltransferase-like isoleucine patch superfamily enzyme